MRFSMKVCCFGEADFRLIKLVAPHVQTSESTHVVCFPQHTFRLAMELHSFPERLLSFVKPILPDVHSPKTSHRVRFP